MAACRTGVACLRSHFPGITHLRDVQAVEWDELETGQRHEGMFYSLITLMNKVAGSVAIPLALALLEWTGYVPNAAQQPASAVLGIRILVGPIPALLLCGGILFAWLYPLSRERHQAVREELEHRRLLRQKAT